jgi:hypothetical protein
MRNCFVDHHDMWNHLSLLWIVFLSLTVAGKSFMVLLLQHLEATKQVPRHSIRLIDEDCETRA